MKIALFAPGGAGYLPEEVRALDQAACAYGIELYVNSSFAEAIVRCGLPQVPTEHIYDATPPCGDVAMMVCYGGDGTFLEGVRRAHKCGLPVLGINSGRLGFLANVPKGELDKAFGLIAAGRYRVGRRSIISVEGDFVAHTENLFAFNELTIHRGTGSMIPVEVYVDGEMVGRYWGDGVIISTPSGSTAYSLSVGGPILAPGCECLVISPIAPHNLSMRPVVIPDSSLVELRVNARDEGVSVALDNRKYVARNPARFRVAKGESSALLVELGESSFYDTLRNKMMWGLDRRDDGREGE